MKKVVSTLLFVMMIGTLILPSFAQAKGYSSSSRSYSGYSSSKSSSGYSSTKSSTGGYTSSKSSSSGYSSKRSYSGGASKKNSITSGKTSGYSSKKTYSGGTDKKKYSSKKSYSSDAEKSNSKNKTKSILTHAAAFGAGTFLGSMLHPFGGGGYNGESGTNGPYIGSGFSFAGLLVDILLIVLVIWIIKKLFFKKKHN